mmetsp:Transcript_121273/g.343190  ORF Transcript_121273/g.343190 Transcript_121273/m.343190 type:complete len:368 (-) Transcript_121273:450-1553(-)
MATWSLSSIISNSSMQQMPLSASIKAPGSITFSLSRSASLTTDAVRPAAVDVLPDVKTARGRNDAVHFRSALLAVAGSPRRQMLTSPRSLMPSSVLFGIPPMSINSMPFLISRWPKIAGAIAFAKTSKQSRLPPTPMCSEMAVNLSRSDCERNTRSSERTFSPADFVLLPQSESSSTKQPKNESLYVRSRCPVPLSPRTPSMAASERVSNERRTEDFSSAGLISVGTSGTTMRLPVMRILSPGLHCSTTSSRTITSRDRGIEPAGTSFSFSCNRMRCQSPHRVVRLSPSKVQLLRLPQFRLVQIAGMVTLNCCSTPVTRCLHSLHSNVPTRSSGFTSVVRVTVPQIVISRPSWSVRRSRIPLYVGRS